MPARFRSLLAILLVICTASPLLAEPKVKRIQLPTDVKLQYVVDGPKDGTPILFLHGYTDSSHSWSSTTPHLSDTYRTYALDQRGHGDSEKPLYGGYSITHYADDVIAFLNKRRIDEVVLVGHSMGSLIAHRVASLHPERVSHLVLVASATTLVDHGVATYLWDEIIGLPSFQDPVDPDFIRDWQTGPNPIDPDFFEKVLEETGKVPARIWKAALLGLRTDNHVAFFGSITAPTTIIWGTQDGFFSEEDQDALRTALPEATFVSYEGGGHNLQWEQPQGVANDIRALIEQEKP